MDVSSVQPQSPRTTAALSFRSKEATGIGSKEITGIRSKEAARMCSKEAASTCSKESHQKEACSSACCQTDDLEVQTPDVTTTTRCRPC